MIGLGQFKHIILNTFVLCILNKIFEKAVTIENTLRTETSQNEKQRLHARFSELDIERARYMHYADKKCNLIKEPAYPWSPKVAQTGGRVSYWKSRKYIGQELTPPY